MTLFAQPAPGPWDAVEDTPDLAPGSVRRTTSIDTVRTDGLAGPMATEIRGRDVRRPADGQVEVVDEVRLGLEIDGRTGRVVTVTEHRPGPDRPPLEGLSVRRGLGRVLAEAMPDAAARRSLLYSVLEDLSGAVFVSGFGPLREGRIAQSRDDAVVRADAQEDVCAGWARGEPLIEVLRATGRTAVPRGPAAPPIAARDGAWHDLGAPPTGSTRRLRRLDVGLSTAVAHFRDSYLGDDEEMVMHEYVVRVSLDPDRLTLASVAVEPRVLPWAACPGAVASAAALVGARVDELPGRIRTELVGPTTCTHLNSTLRSLADVKPLVGALENI